MARPLLVLKAGSTVPSVLARRGDFEGWFLRGLGWDASEAQVASVHLGDPLPDPDAISGVVVTGSAAMVTDEADWSVATERWLARAIEADVPILAVCYGHHLLARALGGAAGWNPQGREIGTVQVELEAAAATDPLFAGLPAQLRVQETHSQSVLELPPGARHLAGNAHDDFQAFAVGEHAWSVQFHPEFDADIVRGYLSERRGEIAAEGLDVDALTAGVTDTPEAASLLGRFGALVRG